MVDLTFREQFGIQAGGAFFGVLCGFGAAAVTAALDRRRERRKAHRKCLAGIEIDGNRTLNLLHGNLFEIRSVKEGAEKHDAESSPPLLLNRCGTIPVNPSLLVGLRNISLVNDVFQYQEDIRKMNESVMRLNHFADLLTSAVIGRTIDPHTYRTNLGIYIKYLDQLSPFINNLIDETLRLVAAARLMLRDDKTILQRLGIGSKPREYAPDFVRRVAAEVDVLKREVDEVSAKDKKRIAKITRPDGKPGGE